MRRLIIATTALTLAIAPAAFAKSDKANGNHGKGHANAAAGQVLVNPSIGHVVHTGAGVTNGAWTNPAGRTHPHGMPPGQAKKLARQNGGLVVGSVLSSSYPGYQQFNNYSTYQLPVAPSGYEYVRVGNDVYLRQSQTGVIANIIQNLFR